jgi:hypothetical protein
MCASTLYAYFLYKKRELKKFKDAYYLEIKTIFEVTKEASRRSSEEIAKLSSWVKADLKPLVIMSVMTDSQIAEMQTKYNIEEKVFIEIFNSVSDDITLHITERFDTTTDNIQRVYQEELSKLVKESK